MSMAMKYMMSKKKASKDGAPCDEHGVHMCEMCHGGECYADGGEVNNDKPKSGMEALARSVKDAFLGGEDKAEAPGLPKEEMPKDTNPRTISMKKAFKVPGYYNGGDIDRPYSEDITGKRPKNEIYDEEISDKEIDDAEGDDDDLVSKIMKKRAKPMSKGGQVANEAGPIVDSMPAEYDDLVKDDHLAFHETGANSGDELGDAQEDMDRRDIVSMIMKSRKKKDHLPRPA